MVNPIQDPEGVAFVPVASVNALGEGDRMLLEVAGHTIALFNLAGEYYAIADLCSHDDGPVAEGDVDGHEIACPRHGARFDLRTGKALSLPAVVDIPTYPVRVKGDQIEVGIPRP
ncbi:MAG: non-heme iron oxygenase ferredoxin subunit [Anaerolineales bacterium]|jgi:3-phenylpropionate/trans-cinnamate dioxygenase ferredoxin subunit